MSSPASSEEVTVAHSDGASGESSASQPPSLESISSFFLPPAIDDSEPYQSEDDLPATNFPSAGTESPYSERQNYNSEDPLYSPGSSPTPTWDTSCECGGISPHYHSRNRLHDTMNGAHPPTGPRGEATVTTPASPATASSAGSAPKRPGQLQNHVQIARSYVFEQEIQSRLRENGVSQAREDNIRLAGVQWIDNVRRALKLPVRTFNTAVVYYHKFRLQHSDGEYSFVDASAAALFAACKIEDTLKKSRDILCAAHNLKAPRNEQLSPDDQIFEHHSRTIIGLERLMLEASGFDFRNRHPQDLLIKLLKHYNFQKTDAVVKLAYTISLDLYRTWAPLKQTTVVLAFACLELAGRLLGEDNERIWTGRDYRDWNIERGMVMETLLDLLEMYTHHRSQSVIGPEFPVDRFLEVRIPLNQESEERKIPRFTAWEETEGQEANGVNGTTANGSKSKNVSPRDVTTPRRTGSTTSASGVAAGESRAPGGAAAGVRQRVGERGREGTVRFILNPDRERDEKAVVDSFSRP